MPALTYYMMCIFISKIQLFFGNCDQSSHQNIPLLINYDYLAFICFISVLSSFVLANKSKVEFLSAGWNMLNGMMVAAFVFFSFAPLLSLTLISSIFFYKNAYTSVVLLHSFFLLRHLFGQLLLSK